jgi:hypothetical protein
LPTSSRRRSVAAVDRAANVAPQAELNGLRGKEMDKAYERAGKIR